MKHLTIICTAAIVSMAAACGDGHDQQEHTDSVNQVMPPNPDEQGRTDTAWKSDSAMIDTSLNKRAKPLK